MTLNKLEVLGSIKRIRAVLTVVGAIHTGDDIYSDPADALEGVLIVLESVNEDLRQIEVAVIQYA
ncbi:MAG: hypothetical protein JKY50_04985 [Oleispira sp.]|nr:hypothetical protein [Oleispira sp.]